MKLNLGCGSQVPDGWINVDYALGARFMRIPTFRAINRRLKIFDLDWNDRIFIHNLTRVFPWKPSSIETIYCSHTLEHFTREEGRRFLLECHRVLRTDGVIRLVVPDLRSIVDDYTEGRLKSDDFIEELGVLYGNSASALKHRLAPFFQFPHKCMYDHQRLMGILEELGFDATTCAPFESAIEDIRHVELAGRTENAVIVEGRKRAR